MCSIRANSRGGCRCSTRRCAKRPWKWHRLTGHPHDPTLRAWYPRAMRDARILYIPLNPAPRLLRLSLLLALLVAPGLAPPANAAGPDGNVEWTGVSHVGWQDRRPLCPIGGESFQVRFQAYRDDLTAARIRVDGGASWLDANRIGTRGPYDLWAAQVPATVAGGSLRY